MYDLPCSVGPAVRTCLKERVQSRDSTTERLFTSVRDAGIGQSNSMDERTLAACTPGTMGFDGGFVADDAYWISPIATRGQCPPAAPHALAIAARTREFVGGSGRAFVEKRREDVVLGRLM